MEARHASLGRRTLEEIRQKKAAQRLVKASSGPDLNEFSTPGGSFGVQRLDSVSQLSESDASSLVSQLQNIQTKNAELEADSKTMSSELQTKEEECYFLKQRLDELEQSTMPTLRKAIKDIAMEKDAAVVAREDLSARLRAAKKSLKETEEEQYRAEEDAAALRAELNSHQQQSVLHSAGSIVTTDNSYDRIQSLEMDLERLKKDFEQESWLRLRGQQQLAEEEVRISGLMSEKKDLLDKLASLSRSAVGLEVDAKGGSQNSFLLEDKVKLEQQLHDMAIAFERLEASRQKLLLEIDSQSFEIEMLFEENSNLSSAYQDAMSTVHHWENQVNDCLKQNKELRAMLKRLRDAENSTVITNDSREIGDTEKHHLAPFYTVDVLSLKGQLEKEQSRAEALSAEVMQLSLQFKQATSAYNNLARLYKPVLRNIERGLMKLKQDSPVTAVSGE